MCDLWLTIIGSISYGLDQNGKVFQDVFPNFQEVFVKPILTWAKNNVFRKFSPFMFEAIDR